MFNNVNQVADAGYAYDNNGNYTSDPWATYEWDAANRLTAITYNANGDRTEFTYDGLGRRVKIVEKSYAVPINFTVQPPNNQYGTYSSASVSLATGSYTLSITGLNPTGGASNTALIDVVKRNTTLVANGGFETPVLGTGAWVYRPAGATRSFVGNSGVAKNNSVFTSSNPVAPEGTQVGVVVNTASMSQSFSLSAGTYNINLRAAQRGNVNTTYQQLRVKLQANALSVTSTKQFVWNGNLMAEERDANNVVTRRFYPQGEQISGASYYYMRDHSGSVRELTDSTGAVRARYDYDPYGKRKFKT